MTAPHSLRFRPRPRLLALLAATAILAVFVAANAHLVLVAFSSQPDCVLSAPQQGAVAYRAAKPSC